MSQVPPSSPPRAMYGLFFCLAVVIALGGCSSSARLAVEDRPVPQPRPAVRPEPAPAPNMKSALGRPDDLAAQPYAWNGSSTRIAEGASAHQVSRAQPQPGPPQPQAAGATYQPPVASAAPAPVHLPRGSVLVQPGDTLYGLSRRHNVSISALMDLNKLKSLSLVPGQVLRLPASARQRG